MEKLICPSMMCANYENLKQEVQRLDAAGTDIFHVDIMDGSFVPNYALGLGDLQCIRRNTKKLVDVHLMVERPDIAVDIFAKEGVDIIYVHPETDQHIAKTLGKISSAGIAPGIAINPGTSIETVIELLPLVDYILVMTVNPGFAGQPYLDFVDRKIKNLAELKTKYGFKIIIDGAISAPKIKVLADIGVDGFVLGTAALFGKEEPYSVVIKELKNEH